MCNVVIAGTNNDFLPCTGAKEFESIIFIVLYLHIKIFLPVCPTVGSSFFLTQPIVKVVGKSAENNHYNYATGIQDEHTKRV